jgi:hypothetical protein
MNFTNTGKPKGDQQVKALDGTEITLTAAGNFYAIVQIRENGGGYTNSREIAMYRVDGNSVSNGFMLGDGDYRIFTPGELKNGVNFLTAEGGKTGQIIIQYYQG